MNLMYLEQKAVDDLRTNFRHYEKHFTDKSNAWFLKEFGKHNWIKESKIQCPEFDFDYNDDYNVSDRKNVIIFHGALKDLTPANALDERLWAGMIFGNFWDYIQYRRRTELKSGNRKKVLNSFVFNDGAKRSCFVNCLSRLWWAGFLLYDDTVSDHYQALDIIAEKAFPSNILLLSSNNFTSNKNLVLGIIDGIRERKQAGGKITRNHIVDAYKYFNCIGSITLLDMLSRNKVKNLTMNELDRLYGKVDV